MSVDKEISYIKNHIVAIKSLITLIEEDLGDLETEHNNELGEIAEESHKDGYEARQQENDA